MKVVQNDMVSMEWNADGFISIRKVGFVSAVHSYNGVAVAFRDGKVYTHIDDDGNSISFDEMVSTIKSAAKSKDSDYPYFYDDYAEIYDGEDFTGTLNHLGISEYKEDILARIEDLSGYWIVEERESL